MMSFINPLQAIYQPQTAHKGQIGWFETWVTAYLSGEPKAAPSDLYAVSDEQEGQPHGHTQRAHHIAEVEVLLGALEDLCWRLPSRHAR
eukprot:scaffold453273_cov31-Prasinocladus_malaysianus.AAC.1